MLERNQRLAIYMEGSLGEAAGKMGYGILRYSPNPVACVIDSHNAGRDVRELYDAPRSCPVVGSVDEALALKADVFVLGIAPPGGLIPQPWFDAIDDAVGKGMSIVNGLHDLLGPRYHGLRDGQWIWDLRVEPPDLGVGMAEPRKLNNRRVLMIGTDMAVGKMTAGLELFKTARDAGVNAEFVATGQIGITITGRGVPLDAVRVDFACGALEREVMRAAEAELIIVEGQGALIHPGSTANLPLLRGSCPTHLILCHKARQETLMKVPWVKIPDLRRYVRLYEDLAEAGGTFPRPVTCGVCLNTSELDEEAAQAAICEMEDLLEVPTTDPVRYGCEKLLRPLMS
jgi:uncharacterized NAD-dependent epimerase/dehydratase family protein